MKDVHPGIFVHSIYIEENLDADQRAGFVSTLSVPSSLETAWISNLLTKFGNVNEQLEGVAQQLAGIDELEHGFDAIGFSQGTHEFTQLVE